MVGEPGDHERHRTAPPGDGNRGGCTVECEGAQGVLEEVRALLKARMDSHPGRDLTAGGADTR